MNRLEQGEKLSSKDSFKRQNEVLVNLVMSLKQRILVNQSFLSSFEACLKCSFAQQRGASSGNSTCLQVSLESQSIGGQATRRVCSGESTSYRWEYD